MLVRFKQRCFINWMRNPGEEAEVADHLFSEEVMERIEASAPATPATTTETELALEPASEQEEL